MTGYLDFVIRVQKKDAGDLIEDIATLGYAQFVNIGLAVPSNKLVNKALKKAAVKALPPPLEASVDHTTEAPASRKGHAALHDLTIQQKTVLNLIAQGIITRDDIQNSSGMKNALRVINNLKRFGLIKGSGENGYQLTDKGQHQTVGA